MRAPSGGSALANGPDALSDLEKEGALYDRARRLLERALQRHPQVTGARLFGSRAMGTHRPESDIDLALYGDVDTALAARIAGELDELPLPYEFDVWAYSAVGHPELREHIDRVGRTVFTRSALTNGV